MSLLAPKRQKALDKGEKIDSRNLARACALYPQYSDLSGLPLLSMSNSVLFKAKYSLGNPKYFQVLYLYCTSRPRPFGRAWASTGLVPVFTLV